MGRAGKALGTRLRICFIYFAENSSDRERLVFLCFMAREFFLRFSKSRFQLLSQYNPLSIFKFYFYSRMNKHVNQLDRENTAKMAKIRTLKNLTSHGNFCHFSVAVLYL